MKKLKLKIGGEEHILSNISEIIEDTVQTQITVIMESWIIKKFIIFKSFSLNVQSGLYTRIVLCS